MCVITPVGSNIRASFLPFRGKKFGNAEMRKDPKLNVFNARGLSFLSIPSCRQVHHLLLSTNRAIKHDHLPPSLVQTELTQQYGAESGPLAPCPCLGLPWWHFHLAQQHHQGLPALHAAQLCADLLFTFLLPYIFFSPAAENYTFPALSVTAISTYKCNRTGPNEGN